MTADPLLGVTRFVFPGDDALYVRAEDYAELVERVERAETALHEIHEYHCGCDQPGQLDFCVAEPREDFKALAAHGQESA